MGYDKIEFTDEILAGPELYNVGFTDKRMAAGYDLMIHSIKGLDGSAREPYSGADINYTGGSDASDMQDALTAHGGGRIYIDGLFDGFSSQFTVPDYTQIDMPFAALRAAGDNGADLFAERRIFALGDSCVTQGMDSGWVGLQLAPSYKAHSAAFPTLIRRVDTMVSLQGVILPTAGGTIPNGATMAYVPKGWAPSKAQHAFITSIPSGAGCLSVLKANEGAILRYEHDVSGSASYAYIATSFRI